MGWVSGECYSRHFRLQVSDPGQIAIARHFRYWLTILAPIWSVGHPHPAVSPRSCVSELRQHRPGQLSSPAVSPHKVIIYQGLISQPGASQSQHSSKEKRMSFEHFSSDAIFWTQQKKNFKSGDKQTDKQINLIGC